MLDLTGKKVLLFTSKLFDYQNKIKSAIESQGAIVRMYDERDNPTSIEKIVLRKAKKVLSNKYFKYYKDVMVKRNRIQSGLHIICKSRSYNA